MKNDLIDRKALWLALEDLRLARDMSWRDVADEVGVEASTLASDQALGDDEVFRLLSWLDADWREFVHVTEN